MGRIFITSEQAINCLKDGQLIHTIINPYGAIIGCDWSRESVIEALKGTDQIEIGGEICRKMNHALVAHRSDGPMLFIEAREDKIDELAPKK